MLDSVCYLHTLITQCKEKLRLYEYIAIFVTFNTHIEIPLLYEKEKIFPLGHKKKSTECDKLLPILSCW